MLSACSKASDNKEIQSQNNEVIENQSLENKQLSENDLKIIDKYNQVFTLVSEGEDDQFKQELERLLPEIVQIKNKKEREKNLMTSYLQLEMFEEAYELNQQRIIENPSLESFQCLLMKQLKRSKRDIEKCNQNVANHILMELSNSSDLNEEERATMKGIYYLYMLKQVMKVI